jgi:2-polyprenyl-3-methyl-5-hydroxy-6-metoxy-1,4-benzoquinol methylase
MSDSSIHYQSMLETVQCNICGADDYEVIYPARYEDAKPGEILETFRSSGDEILVDQLVCCRNCGLQYLTPRLKSDVIIDGYSSGTDEAFISQNAARERTFSKSLKHIERIQPMRGRLLDIGTAGGAFLGVAVKHGWEVFGCEPNRWLARWGSDHYGIRIKPGTIFDMDLDSSFFDVVTLWDVLEHTPDPKRVLIECNRILKPGGLIIVNYPNINSIISRIMGRKWVFLLSVHLYYFSPMTIQRILLETGFEIKKSKRHWQSLELGYILFRMEPYMAGLSKLGKTLVESVGLNNLHIPYWMGQELVVAENQKKVEG